MTLDEIKVAWDKAAAGPLMAHTRFEGGALILGAGTVLAKAGASVSRGAALPGFPIFILRADGPGRPYHVYGPKPLQ